MFIGAYSVFTGIKAFYFYPL